MLPRVFPIVFCALLVLAPGRAQEPVEMLSRNWTTRDGLPQDHVRAMVRTRDGFLWLGTDAGLSRFDGQRFKNFGLRDGLGAVSVVSLLEGRDGTLWIGTTGGGVSALREGRIVRTFTRADGLPSASAAVMAEDAEGRLWVAERGNLAWLENNRFVPAPAIPRGGASWIRALLRDRAGALWVGLSDGAVWTWNAGTWTRAPDNAPRGVVAFCEDAAGRLWAGDGEHRLWCREGATWQSYALPGKFSSAITSIAAAPDGTIWTAVYRFGLYGLRAAKFLTPVTRSEQFLDLSETVLATPDGQLWLASSTNGLYALNPLRLQIAQVQDEAADRGANFIGALVETAPGEFLIGTQGRGFYRWRDGVSESLAEEPAFGRYLFGNVLLRTRDGSVWAGTGRGLFQFRDRRRTTAAPPGLREVWDLCADRAGGLWVGMGSGELLRLDGKAVQSIEYGGRNAPIKGLAQGPDGALWIGTRGNGLFRLHGADWRHFGRAEGLPSEVVRVLHFSRNGTLWIGTAGGGLALRKDDRFLAIGTQQGLPDDTVSQIATDDEGRLWVGTNRGLAVLAAADVAAIEAGRATTLHPLVLDRFDGLPSEEFTIVPPVKCRDGRLAFATTRGFVLLRPGDFRADENTPPIALEQVLADGRVVEPVAGKIALPPGVKRLEFQFTGLHFAAPERLRFRNRLSGLESDWGGASTERNAEYRNLQPGHYRFEVSASTGNGRWSPQPAALDLTLAPHFWERPSFQIAVALVALVGVGLAGRQRERRRAQRRIEALERQQAVDAERARIARDLHDDVGASLTQVALLSELVKSNLAARPERAGQQVSEIFHTAKEVTRALDEIVWAVNPAHDTLESFALFLGNFAQNYSHTAGLRSRLEMPDALPAIPFPSAARHHLYLATKEILHNIVKHARASEIRLSLGVEGRQFRLRIADNGQGFASDGSPPEAGADGLLNLRRRLEQIGGTCLHHSEPGRGTAVEMLVPLDLSA